MPCIDPKVGERLAEYAANLLQGEERRQLEDHLLSCDVCAEDFGMMALTLEAVEALPQAWVVEDLLSTGQTLLRQAAWEAAAETFQALLRIAPEQQEAQAGLRQAAEQLFAVGADRTMKAPEAAWEPVALATALQQAQQQVDDPAWRARLARWQTRWAGKAQAAARLVVQAADEAARVVTEGLEALTTPGNRWDFALASVREAARGRGEDRDVAQRAAGPGPAAPQVSIWVEQASPGAPWLIQVSVQALPAQPVPPLVLLIPATAGGVLQVAALAPRPPSTWLVAWFRNVPQGDYLLAFEPMEDINPP